MKEYLADTKKAFDSASVTFDEDDRGNAILQWMRSQAYKVYLENFADGDKLLELNSGTGIDAFYLASKGIGVYATDISTGMIGVIRQKLAAQNEASENLLGAEVLSFDDISGVNFSGFDGVISNFGGLNCIPDFTKLSHDLSLKLKPGGKFIAVVIGRLCPWETFFYSLKFQFKTAFRRFSKGGVDANLNGETIRTFYFTPARFAKDFEKEFTVEKIYSHGAFTPPPYLVNIYNQLRPVVKVLMKLDEITREIFPFNRFGDHFIIVLRKT